jgi:hypothetical protein
MLKQVFILLVTAGWATAILSGPPARAQSATAPHGDGVETTVYYDAADEAGNLVGGHVRILLGPRWTGETIPARVTSLVLRDGPPANRIDLVTVGDGYTADQLGTYAAHVNAALSTMFSKEPFQTYASFFNVHQVDVISNESGVDHDPTYPIWRDTALDMGFWCEGIERLLCVDIGKAQAYASNAPDVDMILAVANSTKYGGAGYSDEDLATVAGGSSWAPEIALHEFGHSLGNLADEYFYGDGSIYPGPEPVEPNVSMLTAAEMAAAGTKWASWLSENNPSFDGLVSTYEGATYYDYGVYRPTYNSKMRSLNRPFNLPSVESLVIEMYKIVRPIDAATPTDQTLHGSETVFVDPVQPVDHALDIQWHLDGAALPGATGSTLDLTTVPMSPGQHLLAVDVVDDTWFVRNATARATWLTDTRSWAVVVSAGLGDLNCDGAINAFDIDPFVLALIDPVTYAAAYPDCRILNADCNSDGAVNAFDIDAFVDLLTGG